MAPRGAKFPRKFGPGGPNFGGAKFPGTPVCHEFYGIGIYADIHNSLLNLSARVATTCHGYFHLESNQIKPIWDS